MIGSPLSGQSAQLEKPSGALVNGFTVSSSCVFPHLGHGLTAAGRGVGSGAGRTVRLSSWRDRLELERLEERARDRAEGGRRRERRGEWLDLVPIVVGLG